MSGRGTSFGAPRNEERARYGRLTSVFMLLAVLGSSALRWGPDSPGFEISVLIVAGGCWLCGAYLLMRTLRIPNQPENGRG